MHQKKKEECQKINIKKKGKNDMMKKEKKEVDLIKVENMLKVDGEIDKKENSFEKIMLIYKSAIKVLRTKLDILDEEFNNFYDYNPIDHITERIKSPESIIEKMNKKKLDLTYRNLIEEINDIAGIRIVCSFKDDVFKIVDIIEEFQDIEILERKDYITKPKSSGYSSYHMILNVPVTFSDQTIYAKVEAQIRTVAMDFWASLEHKLKYKKNPSKKTSKELIKCASIISKLDEKMLDIKCNV